MIYIIITTSINNKSGVKNDIHRENRYTECIKHLLELIKNIDNLHPVIVENNSNDEEYNDKERVTYLNYLGCDVHYTENNKYNLKHKECNELLDIKSVIDAYNIDDNDTIIKLTGRYKLINLDFINLVINNCDKIDAFVKFFNVATKKYHDKKDDCVLGLLALKCKYFKNFEYKCEKSPECEIASHIKETIDDSKIIAVENLCLECCFGENLHMLTV